MRQIDAVRKWVAQLDDVDRGRVLRLPDDELLAEDLATGLAMQGVTVVPADVSPVDGRPEGWWPPPVLDALPADLRGDVAPSGPGGRLCQRCGDPVVDGDEWVEVLIVAGLSALAHVDCSGPDPT